LVSIASLYFPPQGAGNYTQIIIKNAIESEIKNLQRSLSKTNQILLKFEEKYQIYSDFFINHWTAENLEGGDDEYVSWAGEIQIKHKLINSLQKLETTVKI